MTSRKYVMCVVSLLYVFMILNITLWHCLIKQAFTQGDLNRLGSFISTEPLTQDVKYAKHHTSLREYITSGQKESFDVITIGDSFSSGAYQDYLVNQYGIKILNAGISGNSLEDVYILVKSGIIDEIHPKAIILESVERSVQGRLGMRKTDSEAKSVTEAKELIHRISTKRTSASLSSGLLPPLAVNAAMNFIYNKLSHIIDTERLSPEVYITDLNRNFFTNPGYEHTLLHYYEDLNYLTAPVNTEIVNMNLNHAARILREKNIQLIFFAGVDKYDLYYPYITNHNSRPENQFFHDMRNVSPKDYVFIDTMKIFREALERGEQDIYWFGDTHWSWKGMQLFCDELVKYFNWLN